MKKAALVLINFYQKYLSPLKGPTCRFVPSCSDYAREAISKKGLIRGAWQALGRIFRCHPLHPGGHDPA